jgi:hypothetical protein
MDLLSSNTLNNLDSLYPQFLFNSFFAVVEIGSSSRLSASLSRFYLPHREKKDKAEGKRCSNDLFVS